MTLRACIIKKIPKVKQTRVIIIMLALLVSSLWADVHGSVSMGAGGASGVARGVVLLGYNIDVGEIVVDPYFKTTTYFYLENFSGKPFRDIYEIGLKIYRGPFYIQVYHYCDHPVSYINMEGETNTRPIIEYGTLPTYSNNVVEIGYKWGKE